MPLLYFHHCHAMHITQCDFQCWRYEIAVCSTSCLTIVLGSAQLSSARLGSPSLSCATIKYLLKSLKSRYFYSKKEFEFLFRHIFCFSFFLLSTVLREESLLLFNDPSNASEIRCNTLKSLPMKILHLSAHFR